MQNNADSWKSHVHRIDWGLPKVIISNRDRKFLTGLWKALLDKLGVKLLYPTAFHPQTDAASERTNQTVEITIITSEHQKSNSPYIFM
jgi:capsule polysaccharide export protein KpsC/LpsZ